MAISSQKDKQVTRIFTDGACSGNPGVGGWGTVILSQKKAYKFSGYDTNTTNNRMELLAVISGLRYAEKLNLKKVHIYSDSAYVVNAITKGWIASWQKANWQKSDGEVVKNSELWARLVKLLNSDSFEEIKFHKVRGHSGNHFNEMADAIAKEAVAEGRRSLDGTRN